MTGALGIWRRRVALGLPTVLGLARRGWFVPHAALASLPGPPSRYAALEPFFADAAPRIAALAREIAALAPALDAIGGGPPPAPRWDQDWFPALDAAAAYAFVRTRRPRRIVEIGSGHSTRFLARAVADARLDCRITCVDPAPRATLPDAVRHVAAPLQRVTEDLLAGMATGDILFVDSSHVAMPGSDVDVVVCDLVPRLPRGVLLHVHDIFLPDRYPASWDWRGYNEHVAVAALLAGGRYRVEFASHYAATSGVAADSLGSAIARGLPGCRPASLWLADTGPA